MNSADGPLGDQQRPAGRTGWGDEPELILAVDRPRLGLVVLVVVGDLDMVTTPRLQNALDRALQSAPAVLVVDLTGVVSFASDGIRVLLATLQQAGQDTDVRIVANGEVTLQPLRATTLDQELHLYATLPDALTAAP